MSIRNALKTTERINIRILRESCGLGWGRMNIHLGLIKKIASDSVIDHVYDWLCERRMDYSHIDDVWDIRFRWAEI